MNIFSRPLLGRLSLLAIMFCVGFLGMFALRQTPWYRNRLYLQLVSGDAEQQLRAASALAQLGAQPQLLTALKAEQPTVREMAQRGLEYIWFNAAGNEAFELLQAAHRASEKQQHQAALAILNKLVGKYPKFAEGWNRRAAVYWQMSEHAKSQADCERALALNPNHYGALQGLGICRLHVGDVAGACQSLRAALTIIPYDESTRRSLRQCEELLRSFPGRNQPAQSDDLL